MAGRRDRAAVPELRAPGADVALSGRQRAAPVIVPHTASPAEAEQFLNLLWPADDRDDSYCGDINLWTLEGRKSLWFPCTKWSEAAAAAERLAGKANVYCGTALIDLEARKQHSGSRTGASSTSRSFAGTSATASAIPGLWADVDVGGPSTARRTRTRSSRPRTRPRWR